MQRMRTWPEGARSEKMLLLQREAFRYFRRMLLREDEFNMASVFGLYAVLLGPIFDNAPFEKAMRTASMPTSSPAMETPDYMRRVK